MKQIITDSLITIFTSGIIVFLYVALLIFLRQFLTIKDEVFRKLMHFGAFFLVPLISLFSHSAISAAISFMAFAGASYLFLFFFEKWGRYSEFFVERHRGEIRRSFLIFCIFYALMFLVFEGIFDKSYVVVIAAFIWAFSDCAAAIVGRSIGEKHLAFKFADTNKTCAGSIGFLVCAFIVGVLCINAMAPNHPWYIDLPEILICALLGTYVEAISKKGWDTITIPSALSAFMLIYNLVIEFVLK